MTDKNRTEIDREENAPKGQWFPYHFEPDDYSPSVIDASGWLDKPAGRHGWLKTEGDHFVFEDGTPTVFWGTNVTESNVYDSEKALEFARRLAKYGMNAVRFHKFTWPHSGVVVTEGPSTELDPVKMDHMDKFFYELKERGIYVTWSHIFGHVVTEADALESGFVGKELFFSENNSYAIINFAEDMQDLVIKLTTNLLNHKNPYTGMRYADDPALALIELQNEDNIFFCMQQRADKHPFYRKLLNGMFCDWLKGKYGSEEALQEAWGLQAFDEGEKLETGNIYAYSSCWLLSPDSLKGNAHRLQRLLDSARFMHETQNRFYERYVEAIRAVGYQGSIIGSPWMAGKGIPHYYTLYSDALVGPVDRHDYWGGGDVQGHVVTTGEFIHQSMLSRPGLGIMRRSLEQVVDRPFILSEWMSTPPNEWLTEAPFLIAAYGLGLQGWDASFSYAIDHTHNRYNANIPAHLGTYPALSRMLYRGDVKQGELAGVQHIDIDGFQTDEHVPEDLPNELLAVGRVGVDFGKESRYSVVDHPEKYWDKENKVIHSVTGQLVWDYSQGGWVQLNTPGTQGVIGFNSQRAIDLSDLSVKDIDTPFVNIVLASLTRDSIEKSKSLLLTALARSRNTGMVYNEAGTAVEVVGEPPLLVEPVQATIILKNMDAVVYVLDGQGRRTGETVPVEKFGEGISFRIDGRYKALWYEISVL